MRPGYWWQQFYIMFVVCPFRWRLTAEVGQYRQLTIECGPLGIVLGWPSFQKQD